MSDWWRLPATELSAAYREGRASPANVLEALLSRCEQINPVLNAVVTLDAEGARKAARESGERWRAGRALGALDGIPILVKDSLLAKGMRATWGSRLYADHVPAADEFPVARLRAAGAVLFGKTNVPEFTLQGYTNNALFGTTRNPWNTALTPGGSSGGSVAAVAAGLAPLSLCTDGGGSIRRPAAHTGLVGLKPSRGRIPRGEGFPAILLDFEVVGPVARTVADVEAFMSVLGVPDPRDDLSLAHGEPFRPAAPRACRILYVPRLGDAPVDPEIAASVAAAARVLESLGHRVEVTETFDLAVHVNESWPAVSQVGLAWLLSQHPDWRALVTPPLAAMAESGAALPAARYFAALITISEVRKRLQRVFAEYDLVLTPAIAALSWPAGETHPAEIDAQAVGPRGHAVFTAFVNATGVPAISLPTGLSSGGLPIGLQLVGPFGADALLCAIAAQLERARPWAHLRPRADLQRVQ
jgi:aspartyl-tRNA(Asn)/glutamyl-tRNA(Gln) amidotransferase subunit A